jgi:NAD(P) transhydrogenase
MVGQTEEQLTIQKIPYETGIAKYEEIAKAEMLGDQTGMLKLLFHPETLKLLGIHAIGQRATEIIHIGQTAFAFGGTIEFFRDAINITVLMECCGHPCIPRLRARMVNGLGHRSRSRKSS